MRSRQKFEKARGRPSIQEMNFETVEREVEKRRQKKSSEGEARKKRTADDVDDADDDNDGNSKASSFRREKSKCRASLGGRLRAARAREVS